MSLILVIEDEEELQESLLEVLISRKFECVGASNGIEGLKLAKQLRPSLVVCDITMPDLDGYGVLAELRQDPDLAITQFIFLTALADMQNLRQGMKLGADDYLIKPISMAELLDAIDMRLNKQASIVDYYKNVLKDSLEHQKSAIPQDNLTPRQREILQLIAKGMTTKEIADFLIISVKTVETHRSQLMERLGIYHLAGLVRYAIRIGLVDPYQN